MTATDDPIYLEISEDLEGICEKILDRIERGQQKRKACEMNNEIKSKMAQELKLNSELRSQLARQSKKNVDLEKFCTHFASGVTISDNDQLRLENAKAMYEIGKKSTGIRFDFSAPPNVAKGYIKCEAQKTLTPFELHEGASDALWALIQSATTGTGKENRPHN